MGESGVKMKLQRWRKRKTRREMGGENLGRRRRGCLGWERGGAGGAQPTDQVTPNCTNRTKYPGGHSSTTNSITLSHALCHAPYHTIPYYIGPPSTAASRGPSTRRLSPTQYRSVPNSIFSSQRPLALGKYRQPSLMTRRSKAHSG